VRRLLLAAAIVGLACSGKPHGRTVRVAAASDLARAFEDVGKQFAATTGITPVFDFGSSGLLAKQIAQGAPFALFAAANRQYVDDVVAAGRCDGASITAYAQGRIVVWTPTGIAAPTRLDDLADARFERIAIANPDHAPYGQAAKQALERAGLWSRLGSRIVVADSVQATMQYAQAHTVQAAIVALSIVPPHRPSAVQRGPAEPDLSPAVVSDGGTYVPIDASLYDPLDQSLVVCGGGDDADAARQLVAFLASTPGRTIMTRYGFLLPNEQPSKP
jgi:molybdate transport system substrate-binding protein